MTKLAADFKNTTFDISQPLLMVSDFLLPKYGASILSMSSARLYSSKIIWF